MVIEFFIDTVTGQENEIIIIPDFETLDLWGRDDHFRVPSVFRVFGLDVSYRTRD